MNAVALPFAEDWLCAELERGPRPAAAIVVAAKRAGVSERTLLRAKAKLAVVSTREGGLASRGRWRWELSEALGSVSAVPDENGHRRLTSEEREALRRGIDRRQREQARPAVDKSDRDLFRGDPGYIGHQSTRVVQKRRVRK